MERSEKSASVEQMTGVFRKAPHVFVTDYRGLSANQSVDLRRRIRLTGGSYQVESSETPAGAFAPLVNPALPLAATNYQAVFDVDLRNLADLSEGQFFRVKALSP